MHGFLRRTVMLTALLALGVSLSGCSKCGWIWDDWRKPGACREDVPPR